MPINVWVHQQHTSSPDKFGCKGAGAAAEYNWQTHKTDQQVGVKRKAVRHLCFLIFLNELPNTIILSHEPGSLNLFSQITARFNDAEKRKKRDPRFSGLTGNQGWSQKMSWHIGNSSHVPGKTQFAAMLNLRFILGNYCIIHSVLTALWGW